MNTNGDPLDGHVPVPTGGQQTMVQKRAEELFLAALNVAANEVPLLGSVLTEARLRRANDVMERRLTALVGEFKEQLKTVKEDAVDWEFVRSEAFFDLMRQAVEAAVRTRDQQKIEFVARVLKGALIEGDAGEYSSEEYLGLISDLTRRELEVALSLYKSQPGIKDEPYKIWRDETCVSLHMDSSDLSITLSRIASSGLIERVEVDIDEGGTWLLAGKPGEAGRYRVTPAFEKLMQFLFPESESSST